MAQQRSKPHGEASRPAQAGARTPVTAPADLVLVGRFGAAHGVRGEIRLNSFTQEPASIGAYGPLFEAGGLRFFRIIALRPVKAGLLVVRVDGIADRSAAERLTGIDLFVPRSVLPAAAEDEFYHADLIGLLATSVDGAPLGRVRAVLNFGGGDILEIARDDGGETWLLPFTRAAVPSIDFAQRSIVIVPPDEVLAGDSPDGEATLDPLVPDERT